MTILETCGLFEEKIREQTFIAFKTRLTPIPVHIFSDPETPADSWGSNKMHEEMPRPPNTGLGPRSKIAMHTH
jgi:hypothetical protein